MGSSTIRRPFLPVPDAPPGSPEELGPDYRAVREFLRRINASTDATPGFGWARWEWAFSVPHLDRRALDGIGLWERDGRLVGAVVYENAPTERYLLLDPAHPDLTGAIVADTAARLRELNGSRLLIDDRDAVAQAAAHAAGLVATPEGERTSVLDLDHLPEAVPPPGYGYASGSRGPDPLDYHRVLQRGFASPGPVEPTSTQLAWRRRELAAPSAVGALQVAVTAPSGGYAAFCGSWHADGEEDALVEPVATDPDHRRLGAGTAAVVEALRRCAARGARRALVGSDQPFYFAMGFVPRYSASWWRPR